MMNKKLKEILVGKILGDAHLELQKGSKNYRFKIEHSIIQKEYVDWLYGYLKDFCNSPPRTFSRITFGKKYIKYAFNTQAHLSFNFFGQQFYKERRKYIPRIIQKLLTPLSLAVWFMDDGSVKSKETNGRLLNTQGFEKKDVELLISALNRKFDFHSRLRKQKEGYQIFFPAEDAQHLYEIISPYTLEMFYYKLPKLKKKDNTLPKE